MQRDEERLLWRKSLKALAELGHVDLDELMRAVRQTTPRSSAEVQERATQTDAPVTEEDYTARLAEMSLQVDETLAQLAAHQEAPEDLRREVDTLRTQLKDSEAARRACAEELRQAQTRHQQEKERLQCNQRRLEAKRGKDESTVINRLKKDLAQIQQNASHNAMLLEDKVEREKAEKHRYRLEMERLAAENKTLRERLLERS